MHIPRALGRTVLVLACAGCGAEEEAPVETGATCPSDTVPSYEADIAPLMDKYCTRCHASDVPATERRGAPSDHNFDSEAGVLAEAEHIMASAAAGPHGANESMPPEGFPQPTLEERMLLGEWLACQHEHEHEHE